MSINIFLDAVTRKKWKKEGIWVSDEATIIRYRYALKLVRKIEAAIYNAIQLPGTAVITAVSFGKKEKDVEDKLP